MSGAVCRPRPFRRIRSAIAAALIVALALPTGAHAQDPPANRAPQFPPTETGTRSIRENTAAGVAVGAPVAASDADNDALTYTLSGADAAAFEIVASTGQLRTKAPLDREDQDSYHVQVSVSDHKDASGDTDGSVDDTVAVTITILNVDEAAAAWFFPTALRVGEVVKARLTDPDGRVGFLNWHWYTSPDKTDWMRLTESRDQEYAPTAADAGKYLRVVVFYRDGYWPPSPRKTITVTSEDVVLARSPAPRLKVVELVTGLTIPWDLGFAPDGTMLFTERGGTLGARLPDGTVQEVAADLDDVWAEGEAGLMSIALDPDFAASRRFYTCQASKEPEATGEIQVIAWTIDTEYNTATRVGDPLIGGIPLNTFGGHAGCRLRFGPEGQLWVSTGDAALPSAAQDLTSLAGKVLRVDKSTGAAAPGNPFQSRIYTYGHRNPQGLALRPGTSEMWSVEHGPDRDDEINLLVAGANYGWHPGSASDESASDGSAYNDRAPMTDFGRFPGATAARWSSGFQTLATSGGVFLDGERWRSWEGRMAIATLANRTLRIIEFTPSGEVVSEVRATALDGTYGRLRTPLIGPDKDLYLTTSNGSGGDKILKVSPQWPPLHVAGLRATPGNGLVTLGWTTPDDGGSTVTGYELRRRKGNDPYDNWMAIQGSGPTTTSHIVRGLQNGAAYTFQVRAVNAVGKAGESNAASASPAANNAPAFATSSYSRTVAENTAAGTNIGDPVAASDPEQDMLSYSLGGADAASFEIDSGSGQLQTKAALDYETRSSYALTVSAADPSGASDTIALTITLANVDEAPARPPAPTVTAGGATSLDISWTAPANTGPPIAAYDLRYRAAGSGSSWSDGPQGHTGTSATITELRSGTSYEVQVLARNAEGDSPWSASGRGSTSAATPPTGGSSGGGSGGGGGGGAPSGPTPSTVDFEWTVTHDLEGLDAASDTPTGMWSDGATLWLAHNGAGADDGVFAYGLESGERQETHEFELAEANRAPRGIWSDGATMWLSDSGRDRLFAYHLERGERVEAREFALHDRNRDARGIWSDRERMWVLDGGRDALFAYELASGALIAEYALASANEDPRGIWSDGVTLWVSDHGAKRLFAYRLPVRDDVVADAGEEGVKTLERVRAEEFTRLSRAGNNSPRGIWSDGAVMYVADELDDRIYTYNMPDALDARLASLTLSDADIGTFSPHRLAYKAVPAEEATQTTVEAKAAQRGATVRIEPADADAESAGHQLALESLDHLAVTVTSPDGSRSRVYRVKIAKPEWPICLLGELATGFSLLVFEGGSVEQLAACARSRNIVSLYTLHEGRYLPYILDAPEFVNRQFHERFAGGVPTLTPLVAASEGPPGAGAAGGIVGLRFGSECLRGEVVSGFSLVLYKGGTVEELERCARSRAVTALWVLDEGAWVSYVLAAPDFVNREFRERFATGVRAATPLVARSDGPLPPAESQR